MPWEPHIVIVPSLAARAELPQRLVTASGRALAGPLFLTLEELAARVAGARLLATGRQPYTHGHAALLAEQLLDDFAALRTIPATSRLAWAAALARSLTALRAGNVAPQALREAVCGVARHPADQARLELVAASFAKLAAALDRDAADPAATWRVAAEQLDHKQWPAGVPVLVAEELELEAGSGEFLAALAKVSPVSVLEHGAGEPADDGAFCTWATRHALTSVPPSSSLLTPLWDGPVPEGLRRLQGLLFAPPEGGEISDGAVAFVTAPGEAAEARAITRRILEQARRGVPFEEMAVLLPRPDPYVTLFAELLDRLGVPFRVHPSLPLSTTRLGRSLCLLLRCRGLERGAVMEFLTFAPIPVAAMLGAEARPQPGLWDQVSREAGIVSTLERWIIGLRHLSECYREEAEGIEDERGKARLLRWIEATEQLLRLVEVLAGTLDSLAGEAPWAEWSHRLKDACDQWLTGPRGDAAAEAEAEVLHGLLAELALLGQPGVRVSWERVERVLLQRIEMQRGPLTPTTLGAVHIGALDILQGIPFRFVAIPGLAEGRFPGPLRPDPFLLDGEREEIERHLMCADPDTVQPLHRGDSGQLSFDFERAPVPARTPTWPPRLPTVRDRAQAARRAFRRAIRQAREVLVLSYARADSRTGREALPSTFFVAAATALAGRPLSGEELETRVIEDDPAALPLEALLDRSERDRVRVGRDGAADAVAASAPWFAAGRRAALSRATPLLTEYDGLVLQEEVSQETRALIDPTASARSFSATRLAAFAGCGMAYLLRYVLRARPKLEPQERLRLSPLERGTLFHDVAERFLRERMAAGELPLADTPQGRERLLTIARERLDALVAGSPPLYMGLWRRERRVFLRLVEGWYERELANARQVRPIALEAAFGTSAAPCTLELQPGRRLHLEGRIDRVDQRLRDGALVLRDYKTGRAPSGKSAVFETARRLQMPIYMWAARRLFPGQNLAEAALDYVDGGRLLGMRPDDVSEEVLTELLRGLASAMASGYFVQEPSSCETCDFTSVCGPHAALEWRMRRKSRDRRLRALRRLREGA